MGAGLEVHLQMFIALSLILKNLINGEKEQFFKKTDLGLRWGSKETIWHC